MNPNELRALADALEPMARAPRFEDFDVPGFCAWVRACAEAKPVAWTARHTSVTRFALWLFINNALARSERAAQKGSYEPVENVAKYQDDAKTAEEARAMLAAAPAAPHHAMLDSHRRLVEQAIHTAEHPSGMSTHDGKARIDASVLRRMLAIIDSLPAAPQAEPRVVASFYTEDAELVGTTHAPIKRVEVEDDGTLHVFIDHWPQAESKREPLSDEWLARKAFLLGIPLWTLTVIVRAVECAHEIGGSDD
ncbi:MAG: hypothetical protein M9936_28585 [Caldilinea sp.]|nr:hypothetical protein [Caldilinea sp.]